MAKNKLSDLNDHLIAQMERLTDESLDGDDLKLEINRSKAVSNLGKQIVASARLTLDVINMQMEAQGIVSVPSHLIEKKNA